MELNRLTLTEISAGLAAGTFTSRDVTLACLAQAKLQQATTFAYIDILEHEALAQADASDTRRKEGKTLSLLDGVPLGIKDNMLIRGARATAGSNILKNYVAAYDSTVIDRLKKVGAVFLGKTNMDEFAMGTSTETSCHGVTRNPWNTETIPGGSSGGSAVAVAEHSAIAAFGSDTGGSIRQPAAMCGVVGLKPTYGRVSRYGLIAMASSLDQIGPLAKSVPDAAAMLRAIEGADTMDSTTIPLQKEWAIPETLSEDIKGLRIGLPKEYFISGMQPGVEKTVREAIAQLERLGAHIEEISLPNVEHALAAYYVLVPCEVSANLARFDGVRYGARVSGTTLDEMYKKSRSQGFGREVKRRIMIGTYALSSGYYDAYYLKALKMRRLITNDYARVFTKVDCIVTPTSPMVAWKIGEKLDDPLSMYLADIYTVSVNVAGLPGISVPCGLSDGLPVGLQFIGRHFDEKTILNAGHAYMQAAGMRGGM